LKYPVDFYLNPFPVPEQNLYHTTNKLTEENPRRTHHHSAAQ